MFNWLGKKHELHQCDTVIPDDARGKEIELQRELDTLNRQKKEEDHLRKSAEYGLMEASYEMYVTFVTGHQLNIHRKFNGYSEIFSYGGSYYYDKGYNYIKPSVTAAEDIQLTKDTVHKRGITDGDNVYLAHTISRVGFSEITTKGRMT
jgi:hypothetical protein